MNTYNIYQVDAFASQVFGGNPASVMPLQEWLSPETMQQLAIENNQSETVFFVPSKQEGADYDIRWFTPGFEINLCGHATLASAYVLFEELGFQKEELVFHSQSGLLRITRNGKKYCMDFPSWKPVRVSEYPAELLPCLGNPDVVGIYHYREWIVELNKEADVQKCMPDFHLMRQLKDMVIITAPGDEADFVSRFFGPTAGIDEDPVTGSAHSQLIPFWSEKLNKTKMFAKQLSQRGGDLWCEQLNEERVLISGECVLYMKGEVYL